MLDIQECIANTYMKLPKCADGGGEGLSPLGPCQPQLVWWLQAGCSSSSFQNATGGKVTPSGFRWDIFSFVSSHTYVLLSCWVVKQHQAPPPWTEAAHWGEGGNVTGPSAPYHIWADLSRGEGHPEGLCA